MSQEVMKEDFEFDIAKFEAAGIIYKKGGFYHFYDTQMPVTTLSARRYREIDGSYSYCLFLGKRNDNGFKVVCNGNARDAHLIMTGNLYPFDESNTRGFKISAAAAFDVFENGDLKFEVVGDVDGALVSVRLVEYKDLFYIVFRCDKAYTIEKFQITNDPVEADELAKELQSLSEEDAFRSLYVIVTENYLDMID